MKRIYLLFAAAMIVATGCGPSDSPQTETEDGASSVTAATLLNANLASAQELAAVPGVGMEKADSLVARRPFLSMLELKEALGSDVPAEIFASVFVPLNLNTASAAEIQLIPGVGDRMTHEFEEYRPYVSMAQFRREMAKYVDEQEVERLAGYVYVPIDLNTASDEDILAIPGIGSRMLREFKEYRPYSNMEQFRREMGKYVDAAEVARMERYVEIRPAN